ncbi:hypothetical protein [Streptomyces sp. MUM 178J]|uniref:hypothetical protein n=1 Tax=Streptomyces sp. MUM 178J TaxID=2791991 RepID=UPI001F04B63F|nr:hypothetical protein [Streptomyces sp. MUM 178J]WRQ82094.1 hypothetical protein I3F59_023565 [Streptomyces sp. MUM 178J]
MGSLRNPIGPLPSSIYWRRRAVAAALFALVVLLAVWVVSSFGGGGGDGSKDDGRAGGAGKPTPSTITPGPSGSGPAISQQPGGRDESGDSGATEGANGSNGSNGSGSGSGSNSGSSAGSGQDGGGGEGGGAAGERVPAGSSLPQCAPGALKLTLRSVKVSYEPGEKPRFQLVASNTSGTACKKDFGPRAAVVTVVDATDGNNDTVWSTEDCPSRAGLESGSLLLKVPARASITHTVEWDRKRSEPQCATPPPGAVPPGNYLAEARVGGVKVLPAPFRLEKD